MRNLQARVHLNLPAPPKQTKEDSDEEIKKAMKKNIKVKMVSIIDMTSLKQLYV